ncbi:MAG: ketopantoate reductase family protein [Acholeplasmatales bacterium]|nr:ketopantoate reductase family protein [Acholeplasmatales bacterium]
MLKIGIYGLGGVGCAIYNELQDYKELYVLVDEVRLEKYKKQELIINDKVVHPNYVSDGKMDLIIVSVKNYQLKDALPGIKPFLKSDTVILPLLNGITAHDVIKDYYPNYRVLYGVINVESNKVGNICHTSKIINLQYGDKYNYVLRWPLIEMRKIFNRYNINNHIYQNLQRRVWHKWTLNLAINQISALMDATYLEMSHPLIIDTFNDIFDEVFEVSKYYNIGLTEEDIEEIKDRCKDFNSNRVTSLTIDVRNNRENELDYFGLELIKKAQAANIDARVNKTVYNLVKAYSENKKRKGC